MDNVLGSRYGDSELDLDTGELIDATIASLLAQLEAVTAERDQLRCAQALALEQLGRQAADASEARFELQVLRLRFATAAVPEGRLRVRGRIVQMPGSSLAVVADGGRVVRMSQAMGWDHGVDDGAAVVAEATLDPRRGWLLWKVRQLGGQDADSVAQIPVGLHEKLTTAAVRAEPAAKLVAIDQIDKDEAATADLRRHSHHASSISLHVVLVRHRRGVSVPLTDAQACDLKADVADVVEKMLGWRVLACNTGSLDERHRHDHLHLAVGHVDATKPIGGAIGRIKATSSRRMRERHPELAQHEHFWSAGYFSSSFGGPREDQVKAYIAAQAQ